MQKIREINFQNSLKSREKPRYASNVLNWDRIWAGYLALCLLENLEKQKFINFINQYNECHNNVGPSSPQGSDQL